MAKVRLTKNELKKQRDALKRFQRYLPTLQLKKQQLQMVIRQVENKVKERKKQRDDLYSDIEQWIELFGENGDISSLIEVENIESDTGNIAGVDIPVFYNIEFSDVAYDFFEKPLWVDKAIEELKKLLHIDTEITFLQKQIESLGEELRITSQRVNLFEKVKIPETKENIRQIQIYLGDQQTAAVVRGKFAKRKVERI